MSNPEILLIGEAIAGQSAKVRKQLESLIANLDKSTFDIMDLLYEVRANKYYAQWEFSSYADYLKSLNFKPAKAYYLLRIKEVMSQCGIPRADYEPVGVTKLREIATLDPQGKWNDSPMKDYIQGLVANAKDKTLEQIKEFVITLKGDTGEDETVWLNL